MVKSIRHVSKSLYVPLSPERRSEEVENMLETLQAKDECQLKIDGMQDTIKRSKANIVTLDEELGDSARRLKHGELKEVPCKVIIDWNAKSVITIRKDTYEVIEDRELKETDTPMVTDEVEETQETGEKF